MKQLYYSLIFACLLTPFFSFGQNTTEREIEKIASEFVSKMQAKKCPKKIAIQEFTLDKKKSKLGKFVADEFNVALDLVGDVPFQIVKSDVSASNYAQKDTSGGIRLGKLSNASQKIGSELQRANPGNKTATKLQSTGRILESASQLSDIKIGGKNKKTDYDAIITGELTNDEAGEQIRLIIKVLDLEGKQLEIHRGYLTKTPSIMDMAKSAGSGGIDPDGGDALQTFKKNDLAFHLIEVVQVGSTIECHFNIVNEGRADIELYIYQDRSRAINRSGGYEYGVSNLKISDRSDSDNIRKTIVPGSPFPAKVTFHNVREQVDQLSKISMNAWSPEIGHYLIDFSEVEVGH